MKKIKLTKRKYALVDDENYEWLNQWKWHYDQGYARRQFRIDGKVRMIKMHRLILGIVDDKKKLTDHINMNGLDNRKKNLRIVNHSQNQWNRTKYKTNTSGYKGIGWSKAAKKWRTKIRVKSKLIHLGYFKSKINAAKAYDEAAKKYHGKFAKINFTNSITGY